LTATPLDRTGNPTGGGNTTKRVGMHIKLACGVDERQVPSKRVLSHKQPSSKEIVGTSGWYALYVFLAILESSDP
jgi:hypothetical protein